MGKRALVVGMRRTMSSIELIESGSMPEPNSGCWLWLGSVNSTGYGRLGQRQAAIRAAHRLSFVAYRGEIPPGIAVLHRCDEPSCVNPHHLFLGTLSDNVQDCIAKRRHITKRGDANPCAKLTREAVAVIRSETTTSISDLACRFGVSRRAVRFARNGETWK